MVSIRNSSHGGRLRTPTHLAICVLLCFAARPAFSEACKPSGSFPLGHHSFSFRQADGALKTSRGFDPAFFAKHELDKDALSALVPTYPVGLPGSAEPANLPRKWTLDTNWTPALLDGAGLPKISLSGVSEPVYLINGYNGAGKTIVIKGVKVAIVGSAFGQIYLPSTSSGEVWVVDSLLDAGADEPAALRAFGQSGAVLHAMYSELLGGNDIAKGAHVALYRNHLHGADKAGSEHADGVQISGGNGTFLYENTIDFLFRQQNGAVFISNENSMTNIDVVNNLISGGGNGIKFGLGKDGTVSGVLICGNRFLGISGNTSWATDNLGNSAPIGNYPSPPPWDYLENNRTLTGLLTGVDQLGRFFSFPPETPVPSSHKTRINARAARYDTWASEIRAAAGTGNPPPPEPSAPPTAPVLLP